MVIVLVCAHCDREVPPGDYRDGNWASHRVCGGCRQVVCLHHDDCSSSKEE